jgi:hypothetical protein
VKIIFLAYINRSGSTFLSNELSKYSEILVCPESDILTNLLLVKPWESIKKNKTHISNSLKKNNQLKYWELDSDSYNLPVQLKTRFDVFLHILKCYQKTHLQSSKYILYKNERLFQVLPGVLNNMYNKDFTILFLLRDIRAIYYSQSTTLFPDTKKSFSKNPVTTALYWNSYLRSIKNLTQFSYYKVFYEKLIKDFNCEIQRVLDFLKTQTDIESVKSGQVYNFLPESHKKIHANILKAPIPYRIFAWKKNLSLKEKQLIELTSKKYLISLNYEIPNNSNIGVYNRIIFIYYIISIRLFNLFKKIIYNIISVKYD